MSHVVSAGMLQHPLSQYRPLYDPTKVHHGVTLANLYRLAYDQHYRNRKCDTPKSA
jgi:hypothetical protein